ncbi:hypothetical protein JM84_2719 [Dokdonia sp. Hel_I_63]|uniref:hypothetical protein n=1 Tax=Dokdonia sp. Hel_I_63 TaxID=1249996 RepID=UPI0011992383|nr:hypothetical protein [Dokdonia sp. Hel_I_63]TVZ23765.1 hypothetical protein JM84_2719 [Dokdonia sp. Hel_I_63]
MKLSITLLLFLVFSIAIGQNISENEIKELAVSLNKKLEGNDIGNGITVRGCIAIGRTLIYQYDVPENWEAPINIKEDLIANFKTIGTAKTFFLQNVNVDFYYFKSNKIAKKISINSSEFSTYNFKLGDYISIKDHQKAKNVNLKLKAPIDWEILEADRPNIVKKFVNGNNSYMILVKDYMTFISRNETKEILSNNEFTDELISGAISFLKNPQILNQNIVTVDKYPTIEFTVKGEVERLGYKFRMITKFWFIFYEDKMVCLQGGGLDNAEFEVLESLYLSITNSLVFPEQYN